MYTRIYLINFSHDHYGCKGLTNYEYVIIQIQIIFFQQKKNTNNIRQSALSLTKSVSRLGKSFSSFHSILFFHLFQSFKLFRSILFFSTIFFNFLNPYTISLNLNHLYHLEICKVKPFSNYFSNHFQTI